MAPNPRSTSLFLKWFLTSLKLTSQRMLVFLHFSNVSGLIYLDTISLNSWWRSYINCIVGLVYWYSTRNGFMVPAVSEKKCSFAKIRGSLVRDSNVKLTGWSLAFKQWVPECTQLAYIIPNFNSLNCYLFIFDPPCATKWKKESTTSGHINMIISSSWQVVQNLMQGSQNFFELPICT